MKLSKTDVRMIRTLLKQQPQVHGTKMYYYSLIADLFSVSTAYVIDIKRNRVRKGIKPFKAAVTR